MSGCKREMACASGALGGKYINYGGTLNEMKDLKGMKRWATGQSPRTTYTDRWMRLHI